MFFFVCKKLNRNPICPLLLNSRIHLFFTPHLTALAGNFWSLFVSMNPNILLDSKPCQLHLRDLHHGCPALPDRPTTRSLSYVPFPEILQSPVQCYHQHESLFDLWSVLCHLLIFKPNSVQRKGEWSSVCRGWEPQQFIVTQEAPVPHGGLKSRVRAVLLWPLHPRRSQSTSGALLSSRCPWWAGREAPTCSSTSFLKRQHPPGGAATPVLSPRRTCVHPFLCLKPNQTNQKKQNQHDHHDGLRLWTFSFGSHTLQLFFIMCGA